MIDREHKRLRTPAAAIYLGYAESTLEKKRLSGDGPRFIRLGRTIVYDTRDLDAWLADCTCHSTTEADLKAGHCAAGARAKKSSRGEPKGTTNDHPHPPLPGIARIDSAPDRTHSKNGEFSSRTLAPTGARGVAEVSGDLSFGGTVE